MANLPFFLPGLPTWCLWSHLYRSLYRMSNTFTGRSIPWATPLLVASSHEQHLYRSLYRMSNSAHALLFPPAIFALKIGALDLHKHTQNYQNSWNRGPWLTQTYTELSTQLKRVDRTLCQAVNVTASRKTIGLKTHWKCDETSTVRPYPSAQTTSL